MLIFHIKANTWANIFLVFFFLMILCVIGLVITCLDKRKRRRAAAEALLPRHIPRKRRRAAAEALLPRLIPYLHCADRILAHADEIGYSRKPLITLSIKYYSSYTFWLNLNIRFSTDNADDFIISDIRKAARGIKVPEAQFSADLYGPGYAETHTDLLQLDAARFRWQDGGSYYAFDKPIVTNMDDQDVLRKLIGLAESYWHSHHMSYGMIFRK